MSPSDVNDVRKEYGKLARDYDRRWSFYIEMTLRETLERLELRPGESLLDVGCGTGALLEALAAAVPDAKLAGADPSPEMLEVARDRLGDDVVLQQNPADGLAFPGQTFDVVVSTNSFHYFRNPQGALEEMARVMRGNGRVVITDWCDDYLACRALHLWLRVFNRAHFRTYGQKECRQLLERSGFTGVRIDRYKINWFWGLMTAVGRKPAGKRLSGRASGTP